MNGREVSIHLPDLRNQIALPRERSVELLKNSNPKQYEFHKRMQKEYEGRRRDYRYNSPASFIEWKIIFDHTGKVLSKETPDLPLSFMPQANSQNMVYSDTISKGIITHKIVDRKLINFISEFDKKYLLYSQRTRYNNRGISLFCTIHSDSIVYYVSYMFDIGEGNYGIIVCEPINGKEVTMNVFNLHNHITLPRERSVELLKRSNPSEYRWHKQKQREYANTGSNYIYYSHSSFPFWIITFDKHTGKVLSKYTPNRTKEDEKYQNRSNWVRRWWQL